MHLIWQCFIWVFLSMWLGWKCFVLHSPGKPLGSGDFWVCEAYDFQISFCNGYVVPWVFCFFSAKICICIYIYCKCLCNFIFFLEIPHFFQVFKFVRSLKAWREFSFFFFFLNFYGIHLCITSTSGFVFFLFV